MGKSLFYVFLYHFNSFEKFIVTSSQCNLKSLLHGDIHRTLKQTWAKKSYRNTRVCRIVATVNDTTPFNI